MPDIEWHEDRQARLRSEWEERNRVDENVIQVGGELRRIVGVEYVERKQVCPQRVLVEWPT